MVRRSAFTLIELIFAIVIIAVSVVSLPMMNQAISKGIDDNLVQEAIFAAATELNEAVTASWDDNSIDPTSPNSYTRVLDHSGNCDTINRLMPGHINQPKHRRCIDSNTTNPADSNTNTTISLDDIEHGVREIFIDDSPDATGYKKKYRSEVTVTRNVAFNGINNPDVKSLVIKITDETGIPLVQLITYSANIGEIDYYKRSY